MKARKFEEQGMQDLIQPEMRYEVRENPGPKRPSQKSFEFSLRATDSH